MPAGFGVQNCLPRGIVSSESGSSARTTTTLSRARATFVMSALNGVCPPSWRAAPTSLAQHLGPYAPRPEMQDQAFGLRRNKAAPVPDHVARQLADAGQLGLRAEGDQDPAVEARRVVPGSELPLAIQAEPR